MAIFSKLFGKNKTTSENSVANGDTHSSQTSTPTNLKIISAIQLNQFMRELLSADSYIAKSRYTDKLSEYDETVKYFLQLKQDDLLETFCAKYNFSAKEISATLSIYSDVEKLVKEHNEKFIAEKLQTEKEYLDSILQKIDANIKLDEEQRKVVLCDEDYCLVIAGAGAGKTTTVAAKVKYLVEKQNINAEQILVVSFTNKAVNELKEKINKHLGIACPIATFHSTGNAILHKRTDEKLNIIQDGKLYYILQDFFRDSVLTNETLTENLVRFFSSYFDAPPTKSDPLTIFNKIAKSNYSTLKSELDEFREEVVDIRTKKHVTIQNEVLRSQEEVEIANFLYLNNIDYVYEPMYPFYFPSSYKPYTPDFKITQSGNTAYIEHFGITQDWKSDRYSDDELALYKKQIKDKYELHQKHGTKLIYTFSQFNDNRPLTVHLQEKLIEAGFTLSAKDNKEVMQKIVTQESNRYVRKLIYLICRFISNFKTNGYTIEKFDEMKNATTNVRSKLFLDIAKDCFREYSRYLEKNNAIDFEDMINESARLLREAQNVREQIDFKYIIVDEYQDISMQRFDLVSALRQATNAKIIAVGDDWQSIYAFSGSDITLFTNFAAKMGYAELLKITQTYRNSQEVIDIAGNFIQKNEAQITKALKSPKNITDPVIIYTYDGSKKKAGSNNRSGSNYNMAHAVEVAIEHILAHDADAQKKSILLLGRFGFDGDQLERSGLFEFINRGSKVKSVKYPKLDITFMTAHASKGLGYDNVIVINGRNETYGFPSKIEDDPVLAFVIKEDKSIEDAEERRLFYVAMTRTKNRVYFVAPEKNPSEFLLEIKRDYKNVVLQGEWNETPPANSDNRKSCPLCGYPLQYRYKNSYGLKLWLCTNEPEVCGFMTNAVAAGKLSIMKCSECATGFLIAKPTKNGGYFLGCTNYKDNGKGCSNIIWKEDFYKMMNLTLEDAVPKIFPKGSDIAPKNKNISNNNERGVSEKSVQSQSSQSVSSQTSPPTTEIRKAEIATVMVGDFDLNEIVFVALSCLSHISENHFYGKTVLADVLRGAESNMIKKMKLYKVAEYSSFEYVPREIISAVIDWLIENHFALETKAQYPVLHPTYEGTHYSEKLTVRMLQELVTVIEREE